MDGGVAKGEGAEWSGESPAPPVKSVKMEGIGLIILLSPCEVFELDVLEARVARAVLERPGSEVVASGGGFPTFAANRALVRETNTLVVAIEAPFETLWARIAGGSDRPLARRRDDTAALHARRAPVYHDFCDIAVETSPDLAPADVAARIAALLAP